MARTSKKTRKTKETDITLSIDLDGSGKASVDSKISFLDHMLELLAKQSSFNIELKASGDLDVDLHHTVEDIGLVLGEAVNDALGDKKGIRRYFSAMVPMDEALVLLAIDISGRPYLAYDVDLPKEEVGGFSTDLLADYLQAFTAKAGVNLHLRLLAGRNSHHIIEAVFKGLGLVLKEATRVDSSKDIPSTKGVL